MGGTVNASETPCGVLEPVVSSTFSQPGALQKGHDASRRLM
jgi:hypothetical protein